MQNSYSLSLDSQFISKKGGKSIRHLLDSLHFLVTTHNKSTQFWNQPFVMSESLSSPRIRESRQVLAPPPETTLLSPLSQHAEGPAKRRF